MNIKLTLTEATELIRQALKVPKHQDLKVQIFVEDHPLVVLLHQVKTEFPHHTSHQKISAIKKFRDLSPQVEGEMYGGGKRMVPSIGLAEAKWAVENMQQAIDNLTKYGKIQL